MDFKSFKEKYEHKPVEAYPNTVTKNPIVSVCVQTYQHALYIKKCLDGILMQKTDFEFEILLGEDASNDGTREICLEYAKKYPEKIRLFLHHRENNISVNGNPTGRFNFLYNLYNVKGKYIAFCEGDDYWIDPLKLHKQVNFLEANKDYSLSVSRVKKRMPETNEIIIKKELNKNCFKKNIKIKDYLLGNFSQLSTFMCLKENLNFPSWFVTCTTGDFPLVVIATGEKKIKYHLDFFSIYRINKQSLTHKINYLNFRKGNIQMFKDINAYTDYKYKDIIKWRICMVYLFSLILKYKRTIIGLPLKYGYFILYRITKLKF